MGAITLADPASVLIKGNISYSMKTIFNLPVTTYYIENIGRFCFFWRQGGYSIGYFLCSFPCLYCFSNAFYTKKLALHVENQDNHYPLSFFSTINRAVSFCVCIASALTMVPSIGRGSRSSLSLGISLVFSSTSTWPITTASCWTIADKR